jgi:aspartokinase/homoserine dehydrogenase 1
VRAVHAAFNLARERVNVLLLGKGTVGSQLLGQIASEAPKLREAHDLDLRLAGLAGRSGSVFDEAGLDPRTAAERLPANGRPAPLESLLDRLARLPVPVLVDCTAGDGMEAIYRAAFARGVHVVAANKKALALPLAERDALFAAAHRAHRAYLYETTVGAGLPVIGTLKSLVRTGDRVLVVLGSLSGTLGYLANEVMSGRPLSEAVREARARGYTEPHPREDLAGTDSGRKALILARELGMRVEWADVTVEPFVPAELLAGDDVEDFFAALRGHDAAFAASITQLKREGRVLRYLVRIEPGLAKGSIRVAPVTVPADHPATRLRGSEAFVAFTTERYSEYPLVVQGAGAGGAVTAAGVLADVLALSQTLRGR